jgi:uncharacterized caspase-like protein
MRKALVIGINYYEKCGQLNGCVTDACDVKNALERNADGTLNFDVLTLLATSDHDKISKSLLKEKVKALFAGDSDIALFYYAGHGYIENTGGYLVTSECTTGDDGLPLSDLMTFANESKAKNKVIILDSCQAGIAGDVSINNAFALISDGMTILTACEKEQYASEKNGHGVFTSLLVDALLGGASNLVGDITPGSIYAHIDQSLGSWDQRPVFKTNVKNFISLRRNLPPISLQNLKEITSLFKNSSDEFILDPSFEPTEATYNDENGEKFKVLQNYVRVNLVRPVGEEHMYYAAINNKSCKLTALGVHYWNLVKNNRI